MSIMPYFNYQVDGLCSSKQYSLGCWKKDSRDNCPGIPTVLNPDTFYLSRCGEDDACEVDLFAVCWWLCHGGPRLVDPRTLAYKTTTCGVFDHG